MFICPKCWKKSTRIEQKNELHSLLSLNLWQNGFDGVRNLLYPGMLIIIHDKIFWSFLQTEKWDISKYIVSGLRHNLTPEMNLFKGQYTLKTVSLESRFSTKEVFLANTPQRTLLSYLGKLFIPTLSNALSKSPYTSWKFCPRKSFEPHIYSEVACANLKSTVVTLAMANSGCRFNLVTCYMHHLLAKLGYHSLHHPRINRARSGAHQNIVFQKGVFGDILKIKW